MARAWIEVDLNKLKKNYELVTKIAKGKSILGVVKANAYGCGLVKIGKELEVLGAKILGVATLNEALELRKNKIKSGILIFGSLLYEEYEEAFKNNIQITVSKKEDFIYIEGQNFIQPKVHIKIDTGMGRVGFSNLTVEDVRDFMNKYKKTKIKGIYSHFSSADITSERDYTNMQIEKFSIFENIQGIEYIHIQNSAGIILENDKCQGNLVRPGIMLYGFSDLHRELEPIVALKARIIYLKKAENDMYISYEKEGYVKKGTIIGTVSIGYGDGYPRRFSSNGIMYVSGMPCKVLGKVCMDMTMIEIPSELECKIEVGEVVDVFSNFNNRDIYKELKDAKISPYEYLVGITQRVERKYIGGK